MGIQTRLNKFPRNLHRSEVMECDSLKLDYPTIEHREKTRLAIGVVLATNALYVTGWDLSPAEKETWALIHAIKISLKRRPRSGSPERLYVVDQRAYPLICRLRHLIVRSGATLYLNYSGQPGTTVNVEDFLITLNREIGEICSQRKTPPQKLSEVHQITTDWLYRYHHRPHPVLGMAPVEAWVRDQVQALLINRGKAMDPTSSELRVTWASNHRHQVHACGLTWTAPALSSPSMQTRSSEQILLVYDLANHDQCWACHPDRPEQLHELSAVQPKNPGGLVLEE
ncbi:hypothetical protein [Pseudomonas viridiflava]|uniref:hypothetical protein n=1 Tax=Pseudomonas viridiflava TaxID=33069 RepID=UPI000F046EDA|nr:hypothetical protein [Pseudomonas viridiflava]